MKFSAKFRFQTTSGKRIISSTMVICHKKELDQTFEQEFCKSKNCFVDGNILFLYMQYMEDDEDFIPEVCIIPRK